MNDPDINFWFNEWDRIQAVAVGAVLFFCVAILLMRVLGKRTTSQMNNFDWIVTVAIGSLVSSGILLKDVSVSDAFTAVIVLGACQWFTTWVVIQAPWMARVVKPTPRLLMHDGEVLKEAMRKERISVDELYGRLRENGHSQLETVKWVVLETDGRMTVISARDVDRDLDEAELLGNVKGMSGLKTQAEDDEALDSVAG